MNPCILIILQLPAILREQHVGGGDAAPKAVIVVERMVRLQQVVGWSSAERYGCGGDAVLVAFDLDKRTHRRFVHRDDASVDGKLLAILLVAEPRLETKLFE